MTQRKTSITLALIALAAAAGAALIIYATRYGPGVGGDATIYLTSAQNLLGGVGLGWIEADGSFRLLPYTPPFYPLTLSALGVFVRDLVSGARWLNVLLFAAIVVLAGWYFYHVTRQPLLSGLLSGLLAVSPVIVSVHLWAMSEPLFLFLGFASLFALLAHLEHPRRSFFIAAALMAGLAFITRYIGVAFAGTGALALLLFSPAADAARKPFQLRLRDAVLFGTLASLPMLLWIVVTITQTGTVGSRSAQPAEAYWQRFLEFGPALQKIYLFWLLPDSLINRLPGVVQVLLWLLPLLALLGLVFAISRRAVPVSDAGQRPVARLSGVFGLFILVYLLVLVIVQVFTYPPVTLASRMLSPVHFAVLVLLAALLHLGQERFPERPRLTGLFVYVGLFAFAGLYLLRSGLIAHDYHQLGIGYTAPAWRESGTIAAVRALPADIPLISNETTALMFLAGRPAYPLQEIYQDRPLDAFGRYGTGADESQRAFREQGGALVLFTGTLEEDFAMYGERAGERVNTLIDGLVQYYVGEDGAIYFLEPPAFAADGS